jgi:uncharacterized protein YraI
MKLNVFVSGTQVPTLTRKDSTRTVLRLDDIAIDYGYYLIRMLDCHSYEREELPMRTKTLISILVLFSLLTACQLTVAPPPVQPSTVDVVGTAVELTAAAKFTEMAGSAGPATAMSTPLPALTAVPTATLTSAPVVPVSGPCGPTVTATVNANVRSGPGTAYDTVGSLMLGQTATIVGRNDAYTWWYIAYPGVSGGYAWIAGSVVTSSCVPAVVQVVAAPPTPTKEVADANPPPDDGGNDNDDDGTETPFTLLYYAVFGPDLVASSMQFSPDPAVKNDRLTVTVTIENQGSGDAKDFNIQWWATSSEVGCSWFLHSLAAGASTTLSCNEYIYHTSVNQTVKLVVDSGNAVNETNEDNNTITKHLRIHLH